MTVGVGVLLEVIVGVFVDVFVGVFVDVFVGSGVFVGVFVTVVVGVIVNSRVLVTVVVGVFVGAGDGSGTGQLILKSHAVPFKGANIVIYALVGVDEDFVNVAVPLPGPVTPEYPRAFSWGSKEESPLNPVFITSTPPHVTVNLSGILCAL